MPCTKTGSVGAESGLVFVGCETCLEFVIVLRQRSGGGRAGKGPAESAPGPPATKLGVFGFPGGPLRATKLGRLVVPNFGCAKWDPGLASSAIL